MRFAAVAAALAALPTALGTIVISDPSPTSFWVQNTSNVITWSFSAGDPSPVNIVVVNSDNATLNGPFSIMNEVDLSNSSFTVTNVTLIVGGNYQVEFVSPLNVSQVLAQSQTFSVMPPGTAPAPTSSTTPSPTSNTTAPSGTSSGASSSTSGTSSASGSGSPSPSTTNGARALGVSSVFGVLAACGAAALAVL
ncbi:GPI anchored serine-threonine rich family protein [Phanerochaete sordida]|uniref:GPI anchored serine-threonine rich family protein n=1 Tax=Phanerochaete sordida TaxID=48140 RepID=A0A9P3G4J7_9APHY|nr:GPI anchored serine-threonine rich family protein [Phanerochaete sordida]